MSRQVSLAGRARLGIPKLDTRMEADVRAVRGTTPLRDGADGPPQWRPRQSHLAQRPGREKEKQADTAAPDTQNNNTKHSRVSSVVLTRSVHTQDSITRNSHGCAVQLSPLSGGSSGTQRAFVLPECSCSVRGHRSFRLTCTPSLRPLLLLLKRSSPSTSRANLDTEQS